MSPCPWETWKGAENVRNPTARLPEIKQEGCRMANQTSLPCNRPMPFIPGRTHLFFPWLSKTETPQLSQEGCFSPPKSSTTLRVIFSSCPVSNPPLSCFPICPSPPSHWDFLISCLDCYDLDLSITILRLHSAFIILVPPGDSTA